MTGKPLRSYADLKTPKKPKGPKERFASLRNEPLRAYVRSLGCVICALNEWRRCGPTECAHVKSKGAAGGDDDNVIPLGGGPGGHHAELHRLGTRSFEYKYQIRLKPAARKITASYLKSARSSSPGSQEK